MRVPRFPDESQVSAISRERTTGTVYDIARLRAPHLRAHPGVTWRGLSLGISLCGALVRSNVALAKPSSPQLNTLSSRIASHAVAPSPTTQETGTLFGIIRSSTTGEVLSGASVSTDHGQYVTYSNATGRYQIQDIPDGTHDIVVTLAGYDTFTLSVTIPPHEAVRVDILLTPISITLAPLHILAERPLPSLTIPASMGHVDREGVWHWAGNGTSATAATGEPDIFRMLVDDPNLFARPDRPAVVMDHGLGDDETLVLVDGFPIWNPAHSGNGLSVVTPDAIGGLTLNDGVIPAQYGGRLGSVLDLRTRTLAQDSVHGGVAFGSTASRMMGGVPFHLGATSGSAILAIRRSNSDLFPSPMTNQPFLSQWADGIGVLTFHHTATTLQLLGVVSRDRLYPHGAPSSTSNGGGTTTSNDGTDTTHRTDTTASNNAVAAPFPWSTTTAGIVWTQQLAPAAHLETRLWRAEFRTNASEPTDSGMITLDNRAGQWGAASQLVWKNTTIGTSLEALETTYQITPSTGHVSNTGGANRLLEMRGNPNLHSAFAEQRWRFADSTLLVNTGLRVTRFENQSYVDPRLSLAARATDKVTFTAGYTRIHQFVQSLHNQNAPLSALIATAFPVAAGTDGLPVASSDVVTGGVAARFPGHIQFLVDGYTRRLAGIAIPDPASTHLFADRSFAVAAGHATGAGAALAGQTGRTLWQAVYGIEQTQYTTTLPSLGATTPTKATSQMATASLALQFDRRTQGHLSGWAGTGPQAMQTMWLNQGLLSQSGGHEDDANETSRELDRVTGQTVAGAPRLPSYMRLDVQITHDWPMGRANGTLAAFLTVANVLNRVNVVNYGVTAATETGTTQMVTLAPRSLLGGISWWY